MARKTYSRPDFELKNLQGILTVSPEMKAFFKLICRVSRTDATVLIRGDTGTGKELAARALHQLSPRKNGPWQAINCATLTPELLASELFGHKKGAFTGAVADRKGLFLLASHGSLFLDEIGEIAPNIQASLLRVLQERTFVPVGDTQPQSVDVRVISATNKSLRAEVENKRFREDLMYRIRVVKLFLPRLIERTGDVEALTWHFIEEFNQQGYREVNSIDKQAMEAIFDYHWPGNIRELRNAIEGAFAIGDGPLLKLEELPPELTGEEERFETAILTEDDLERKLILDALAKTRGRKTQAAEVLGMSRATLWRKMRELGIKK